MPGDSGYHYVSFGSISTTNNSSIIGEIYESSIIDANSSADVSYWCNYSNYIRINCGGTATGTITEEHFPEESLQRAKALLESAMDEEQRKEANEKQQFHVRGSSGKMFRIRTTHAIGNVEELDENGEAVARYCAHPRGVPLGDQLLAQKLALETDEDEFLKIANCHWRREPLTVAA